MGHHGDRAIIAVTVASFVALVIAMYRLGRAVATPLVGWLAAGLTLTRLDFAYFAAIGYVDIAYLACVFWAAALEAERPRRGGVVWLLLAVSGLLRPEGWLLAGVYALWLGARASWPARLRYAACAAVAPVLWSLTDLAATGDPLYSFTYTDRSAEALGRGRSFSSLPGLGLRYLSELVKPPVLVAAFAGAVIAWRVRNRRLVLVGILFLCGILSWYVIAGRGLATVYRYMGVAALAAIVLAAFGLGGFSTTPSRSPWRRAWAAGSALVLASGIVFTATHLSTATIREDLELRHDARNRLAALLREPAVATWRRCGPFSTPNQKLMPDIRSILSLPDEAVIARSDPRPTPRPGVVIFVTGALVDHPGYGPLTQKGDSPRINVPGRRLRWIAGNDLYSAYTRCERR
jgi:4-amino-4-deoxy-L-arabinose transferase-like glycosyltransferase